MIPSLSQIGTFASDTGAEIVAFDDARQLLYIVSGNATVYALDISDPTDPQKIFSVDLASFGAPIGGANSIAYKNGLIAIALEAETVTDPGAVAVIDLAIAETAANILDAVKVFTVGSLPDMVTFTPDGSKVLVANEGEPQSDEDEPDFGVDPDGSVSIIDVSGDFASLSQANVATADFTRFNGREADLRADGVRIFPDATVAQDVEPEYIAVSPDGTKAFVTLQENNAIAIIDIATATVESIQPLGLKDYSAEGNGLDASDKDGAINIKPQPVFGLYMPDSIASFESNGETFYVIANEGDDRGDANEPGRGDAIRLGDIADVVSLGRSGLSLDPALEAQLLAGGLLADEELGRLTISSIDGDTDGDGDLDQIVAYGGRSFSVLDSGGNIIFDSGDQIERITAELAPELFNANDGDPAEVDTRSDNKGPEPEAITTGIIDGKPYAFVGLERAGGGILLYDLSNPSAPEFIQYVRSDADIAPEGLAFISAEKSSTGQPLLAVANEVSGTVSLYGIDVLQPSAEETFTLQLLHLSDQEAGISALDDAPRASAVINALKDDYENTLLLSSGDAIIPGLFFTASQEVYGGAGRADILIQNELGIQAIAFGNHEFDLGTPLLRDLIAGKIVTEALPIEEAQQVGDAAPEDTASTGSFAASLSGNRLTVTGSYSDLTSPLQPVGGADGAGNPESAVHIHMGVLGANGPIFRNLTVADKGDGTGAFSGTFDLSDEEVETLVTDGLYVNLHTENNPSGELRGQIDIDLDNPANFGGTNFPYLSSNLDFSTDNNLADLVVPDDQAPQPNSIAATTVIDVNGQKIGVVGATTPILRAISSPGGITVLPADFDGTPTPEQLDALAAEIQRDVDELLAANPDINKVVLLAHMQQISVEQELATRLKNVDIIVAGGSNTRLFDENDRPRDGDTVQGEYPIFTVDADGNPVAVVNTDGNYKYIGQLVIDFDANGIIIPESYDPTVSGAYATDAEGVAALGAEGLVDPEIQEIVDALEAVIIAKESNVFGISDVYLNGSRGGVRTQETNLGNLTADANLAIAKQTDDSVVISIKNGGGIRADVGQVIVPPGGTGEPERLPTEEIPGVKPAGGISQNDIANSLAFNNGLTLLTVTAEELLALIEHGVSASSEDDAVSPGQFPQVAGIEFSFDVTAAPGDRVQSLVVLDEAGNDADVIVQNSELVGAGDRTFRLVTLNFLANGGDEYLFPMRDRVELTQPDDAARTGTATFAADGSEQDALAEYLAANFGAANPFDMADTPREADMRIQNLAFRADTVIDGMSGGGGGNGGGGPVEGIELLGTAADDDLTGGEGNDTIAGLGGNDIIRGTGGDDVLRGDGNGRSANSGGSASGDDIIFGGAGNDRIGGKRGNDMLFGEEGDDILYGDSGDDILRGGLGNDVLYGDDNRSSGIDTFILAAGEGTDTIMDFEMSKDLIGLAGGITFGQLSFSGNQISFNDEVLAMLNGVDTSSLSATSFVPA